MDNRFILIIFTLFSSQNFVFGQFFGDKQNDFKRVVFPYVYSKQSPFGINAISLENKLGGYIGLHFNTSFKSDDYRMDKNDEVYYSGEIDNFLYEKAYTSVDPRTIKETGYQDVEIYHSFTDKELYATSGILATIGITYPIINKRLWLTAGSRLGYMQLREKFEVHSVSVVGSSSFDRGTTELWLVQEGKGIFVAPEAGLYLNLGILTLCSGTIYYPQISEFHPYFGGSIDLQRLFPSAFE